MQITAAAGPTEKRITTGIRYAKAGTICMASSAGVTARWTRSLRPAKIPSGTPIASDSVTAASISASVWMLSSQSPISANEAKAPAVISAARQPPKRSTISTPAANVPTQVSHSSMSVRALTSHSANARKPSKIAKMKFGSARRCAARAASVWKSSSSPGSSVHVSEAGQGSSSRKSAKPTSMSARIAATCVGRPRQRDAGAANAGALTLPLATATRGLGAVGHRVQDRFAIDDAHTRPSSMARTGLSVLATTGTASLTLVVTSSCGPPSSSPWRASRMTQRSVRTFARGMSRTKFSTYSSAGEPTSSSGVPSCTIAPSRMIAIRSPSRSASGRSWVMNSIVLPVSSWSRQTSSCMSRRISGSSALNGSS